VANLTFASIEELQRYLGGRMDRINQTMQTAGMKIANEVQTQLVKYPTRKGPVKWASEKQRRYYHAMRREAGLPMKYTRRSDPMSQRLGQSWGTRPTEGGAILGSRATYSLWAQSAKYQQPMHAETGWTTDEEAVEWARQRGIIDRIVQAELKALLG